MNIKSFLSILHRKFDKIFFKEKIVFGKYEGNLGYSESTFIVNVVLYDTIKAYNQIHKDKLKLSPEHGGRSPTDFCILNKENKIELYIEHENDPKRIDYNLKKLLKFRKAKERLLICYERPKILNKTIARLKKGKVGYGIYIWIGPWDIEKIREFKMFKIGGI